MLLTAVVFTLSSEKLTFGGGGELKVPFLYKCPNNQISLTTLFINTGKHLLFHMML